MLSYQALVIKEKAKEYWWAGYGLAALAVGSIFLIPSKEVVKTRVEFREVERKVVEYRDVVKEVKVYTSHQEDKDMQRLVVEERPDGTKVTTLESDKSKVLDTKTLNERLADTLRRTTEEKVKEKVSTSETASVMMKQWYLRSEWSVTGQGIPERVGVGLRVSKLPLFIDISSPLSLNFKDIRLGVTYEF